MHWGLEVSTWLEYTAGTHGKRMHSAEQVQQRLCQLTLKDFVEVLDTAGTTGCNHRDADCGLDVSDKLCTP